MKLKKRKSLCAQCVNMPAKVSKKVVGMIIRSRKSIMKDGVITVPMNFHLILIITHRHRSSPPQRGGARAAGPPSECTLSFRDPWHTCAFAYTRFYLETSRDSRFIFAWCRTISANERPLRGNPRVETLARFGKTVCGREGIPRSVLRVTSNFRNISANRKDKTGTLISMVDSILRWMIYICAYMYKLFSFLTDMLNTRMYTTCIHV